MRISYVEQLVNRAFKKLRRHFSLIPDWSFLNLNPIWLELLLSNKRRPYVLIATSTGGNWPCSSFESLLGVALSYRGADVNFLLCDGALTACQECDLQWLSEAEFVDQGPKLLCSSCYKPARKMLDRLGLPVLRYSDFYDVKDITEWDVSYGVNANAATLRYYGRGSLTESSYENVIYSKFRKSAEITGLVIRRLIEKRRPDVVVFHHGIYVPQGIISTEFKKAGVRTVNWGPSYRKSSVLFSHDDSYHHTMIKEPLDCWNDIVWSFSHEQRILTYLKSRATGANDWISFQRDSKFNKNNIFDLYNIDHNRPIIGLLTNVIWDAQLHFPKSAYGSMLDWVYDTIQFFINSPHLQLVIRIHPAEVYGTVPSRQPVLEEIKSRFGNLPSHIKLIGPRDKISTYSLMAMCNAGLVYGTKTALELACVGLPVVVAGEAWCRGKGFTIDVSTPGEYRKVLEMLPFKERLSEKQITLARKYAYHFFFRRMIRVQALKSMNRFAPYKVNVRSLEQLIPGADPGLDVICDGILKGAPFVYES